MPKSMRVQIDNTGHIRPLESSTIIPEGHAILTWPTADDDDVNLPLLLSEKAFAAELFNDEEDAAWAYLQPVDTCEESWKIGTTTSRS